MHRRRNVHRIGQRRAGRLPAAHRLPVRAELQRHDGHDDRVRYRLSPVGVADRDVQLPGRPAHGQSNTWAAGCRDGDNVHGTGTTDSTGGGTRICYSLDGTDIDALCTPTASVTCSGNLAAFQPYAPSGLADVSLTSFVKSRACKGPPANYLPSVQRTDVFTFASYSRTLVYNPRRGAQRPRPRKPDVRRQRGADGQRGRQRMVRQLGRHQARRC